MHVVQALDLPIPSELREARVGPIRCLVDIPVVSLSVISVGDDDKGLGEHFEGLSHEEREHVSRQSVIHDKTVEFKDFVGPLLFDRPFCERAVGRQSVCATPDHPQFLVVEAE